ncbi:MAG: DUF262 domain-containing protein [Bacteroidales bacterium]|nr:DUF262 domain-containing protein [Bacteroidales bacterium]
MSNLYTLELIDIASWAIDGVPSSEITCGLPSLQRGAVWKANQVELLWDSLMRGFPIGSLVISEKIQGQKTKNLKSSTKKSTDNVNYHLLDGQQRATTISLGFLDPFEVQENHFSYLWIDLAYDRKKYKNSTRKFLFRLLTPAHPWGYQRNDNASRLETHKIRKHLLSFSPEESKPIPYNSFPYESEEPIPFCWLYDEYDENINEEEYWEKIDAKIMSRLNKLPSIEYKKYKENIEYKRIIFMAIQQLFNTKIPLLEVPKSSFTTQDNQSDVSDIEHLFQRLNQQGTKLEGLELSYSMIKAYWSGIENSFEKIRTRPMSEAYLAMLSIRTSLIDENNTNLPIERSITQIRALAKHENEKNHKKKIETYLGISDEHYNQENFDFKSDIDFLEKILLYSKDNIFGLPPVLRTNIATKSRDVYLLLVWISKYIRENNKKHLVDDNFKKRIIGLATALDLFSDDKKLAVNKIYEILKSDPSDINNYNNILNKLENIKQGKSGINKLVTPNKLEYLLNISCDMEKFEIWDLWYQIVERLPENEQEVAKIDIWPFIKTLSNGRLNSNNKALLLLMYAQRQYMKDKFGHYDSMLEMWSEQNRPWDYDHILPSTTLYNRKGVIKYRKPGNVYLNSIGNLQILAFEDNRSKNDKLIDCTKSLDTALINDDECVHFQLKTSDFNDYNKTKTFMDTAKNRMIKIYKIWWDTLEIEKLYENLNNVDN